MRKQTPLAWGIISFLLLFPSSPALGAGFVERVTVHRLENGMGVILLENHKAPAVTFQVWFRAGSRKDWWGKTGLAHVFEHLMFKGTKQVSREEFSRRIEEIGGDYNAFTSHDFAAYFENVASENIEIPIRLEADRLQNLGFTKEEFKTEKMVVMEERRLRTQDQPKSLLMEQVAATAFQSQPYRWPVIGWMGDLERMDHDDALRFYEAFYDPSNGVIVVVGDFEKDKLLPLISEAFGKIPSSGMPEQYLYQDAPQLGERRVWVNRTTAGLPYVVIGYHVPNLKDADSYVLEVISAILSNGKSSRLFENIVRGNGLAVSVGSDYELLSIDPSLFYVYGEALPGKDAAQLEAALQAEIEKLQIEAVNSRELEKAKNQLEASFLFGQDSLFFQGMLLARYEFASTWKDVDKYLPAIRSVSAEDIQRVAKKYFPKQNRTVGVLLPEDGAETKKERKEK
ncbi:MAG: insulinase family protein [Desulfobacteraceae bacterium]|nr:MAG: insulinase family protein [Desulfobacteraceae bacterium]